MNHILITTALQAEAQPLIEQYQLEKKIGRASGRERV